MLTLVWNKKKGKEFYCIWDVLRIFELGRKCLLLTCSAFPFTFSFFLSWCHVNQEWGSLVRMGWGGGIQSWILNFLSKIFTPNVGLEPTTLGIRVPCSTDWANRAAIHAAINVNNYNISSNYPSPLLHHPLLSFTVRRENYDARLQHP